MKPPPARVTSLAQDLLRLTGQQSRIRRTEGGGYRLTIVKPTGLDSHRTLAVLRALLTADRFGDSNRSVWAELDLVPGAPDQKSGPVGGGGGQPGRQPR
ncbi:hypothetical protein [Kitasatospora sp. NPDC050543]|uniref:hypothetical protein n=1 Tax=Kitasatospora sp. NPDC050543 TaxID=3364054 RepID=UPI0037A636C8